MSDINSTELEEHIDAYIEEVWDELVADIAALVRYPSVADAGKAAPGAPFGGSVRDALDCALDIARRLGYATDEDEGYVGWGDIAGSELGQIATIAHVDVVPAGPGWGTDPFEMTVREGWFLGRGVIDDKGPAVLSLYAGAFLLHEGITPRYTFRALLGCSEECGMTDVHHYLSGHAAPDFLFTPDADFPLCNAEKGCFNGRFVSGPIEGGKILSWYGAEAPNAIPSESVLELAVDASELPAPKVHADRISVEAVRPGVCRVGAQGIGGHASMPAGTVNAIALIVEYLRGCDVLDGEERAFLDLLSCVLADTAGDAMGIACTDDTFGPLTISGGTICVRDDGRVAMSVDVRYPTSTDNERLLAVCEELAARFGAGFEMDWYKVPFLVGAEHPAVRALLDVYHEVTGEEAKPFSMGGGTYARNFPCAVSYGPVGRWTTVPSWVGHMHGPDEGAREVDLKRALKIYILAIMRLMEIDL